MPEINDIMQSRLEDMWDTLMQAENSELMSDEDFGWVVEARNWIKSLLDR